MWDKMKMVNAIKAVRSEEMESKKTLKVFEVPRSTLKNKVKSKETYIVRLINMQLVQKAVLPYSLEVCEVIALRGKQWVCLSSAEGGFTRDSCYLHDCRYYVCSSSYGVS